MTTYILAGGNDRAYDTYGKKLAKEVLGHITRPHILSCFFSQPEEVWHEKYESWSTWFSRYFGDTITYTLAMPATFVEQIKHADVIYLHGGTTQLLMKALSVYPNIGTLFEGKVVIGSSAGTNFLSKVYYSPSANKVDYGSGIVDCLSVVHYGAEHDGEVSLTQEQWMDVAIRVGEFGGSKDIILLPEGEFVVFET